LLMCDLRNPIQHHALLDALGLASLDKAAVGGEVDVVLLPAGVVLSSGWSVTRGGRLAWRRRPELLPRTPRPLRGRVPDTQRPGSIFSCSLASRTRAGSSVEEVGVR